jgi:hypothetical protein
MTSHVVQVMQSLGARRHDGQPTRIVRHEGMPIFTSHGKWLHSLFELEAYLADHAVQPENLILQDKIIGKAAALLIHRLGFHTVQAGLLSRLREAVLQRYEIAYSYEQLVDRIHCQTEELLATVEAEAMIQDVLDLASNSEQAVTMNP